MDVRQELTEKHGLHTLTGCAQDAVPAAAVAFSTNKSTTTPTSFHDIPSHVVYALLIGGEVMKFGKAGSMAGSLRSRMDSTIASGNDTWLFAEGRPVSEARWMHRTLDKFKQLIPDVIRSGRENEIYAGESGPDGFEAKKRELDRLYRPPWVDRDG